MVNATCMYVMLAADPLLATHSWLAVLAGTAAKQMLQLSTYKSAKEGQCTRHDCCHNHIEGPAGVKEVAGDA
jgi:hypothetical protein